MLRVGTDDDYLRPRARRAPRRHPQLPAGLHRAATPTDRRVHRDQGRRDGRRGRASPATATIARIRLDYVTPKYRDFTPGEFVWRRSGLLNGLGFRQVDDARRTWSAPTTTGSASAAAPTTTSSTSDRRRVETSPGRIGRLDRSGGGGGDPAVEGRLGGAGVDRVAGPHQPGGQRLVRVGARGSCTASAAPALSSTASRTAPGSPSSSRRTTSALWAASPPRSASVVPRGDAERGRVDRGLGDLAAVHPPQPRGGRRGQLVEAVVAAEDPGVDAAPGEDAGHHRRHPRRRRSRSPGRRRARGW